MSSASVARFFLASAAALIKKLKKKEEKNRQVRASAAKANAASSKGFIQDKTNLGLIGKVNGNVIMYH